MSNIVTSTAASYNIKSVVSSLTTRIRSKPVWLPKDLFKLIVAKRHVAAKKAIEGLGYRAGIKKTLEAIINLSDTSGISNASHRRLAFEAECSTKTTERHTDKLHADGIITKIRNGKNQTNTYILLFIQPEVNNGTDKMSDDLNPPDEPIKGASSGGVLREENKSESVCAEAHASPRDDIEDIFEDEIPPNEEYRQECLRKMRESLRAH